MQRVVWLWIAFAIVFIGINLLREYNIVLFKNTDSLFRKAIYLSINAYAKAILALVGIIATYMTASVYVAKHTLSKWVMDIGVLGYGVYIFHQFILQFLYYKTSFPNTFGTIWLPWVGTGVALALSLILSILFRQTQWGRKLI